jgi:hypothetical protein
MRDSSVVESDFYDIDYNSEPLFPDYSESTEQDFNELQNLLHKNNVGENDYDRWFTVG